MDTIINVTIYNAEEEHLNNIRDIYMDYSNACDMFNSYEGNLCDLNNKRTVNANKELLEVIEYSLNVEKELGGYFNILIGRITKIWKEALHIGDNTTPVVLPDDELIQEELKIMNESKVIIEGDVITIDGLADIDLGGVAKGYATQKVEEYFKDNNITSYMINAGSSNISLGYKNKDESFLVGLTNLDRTSYFKKLKIDNKAIVTSSIAEQNRIVDGKVYTHIINPLTGYCVNNYDIVTIIGEKSGYLDILSTTLFSMDIEMIKSFLSDKDIDIVLVKDSNIIYSSDGIKDYEEI
jgi:thiamine biosynthesis lipoprotein